MGSVLKKGNSWAIRYDLPGSTREKRKRKLISGFPTEEMAADELKKIEAKITLGLLQETSSITINDVIDKWHDEYVETKKAPSTILFYENYIDNFIKPKIGHLKVEDLKVGIITHFYNGLVEAGASQSTITKVHTTLRTAFYYNYQQEYIKEKFMDRVKVEKYHAPTISESENYWKVSELEKAIPLLAESPIYFNIYMSLQLGLRAEETVAIHVNDINFTESTITIRHAVKKVYGPKGVRGDYIKKLDSNTVLKKTKGKKINVLPMTDEMEKFLNRHISKIEENKLAYDQQYNYIYDGFLSVWPSGELVSDKRISQRFKIDIDNVIKKDAKISRITFHGLRHSCASWLMYKGVDLKIIQEILGHSDILMTSEIYTHIDLEQKKTALNKLSSQ